MSFAVEKNVIPMMPRSLLKLKMTAVHKDVRLRHLREELQRRKVARLVPGEGRQGLASTIQLSN